MFSIEHEYDRPATAHVKDKRRRVCGREKIVLDMTGDVCLLPNLWTSSEPLGSKLCCIMWSTRNNCYQQKRTEAQRFLLESEGVKVELPACC